MEKPIISLFGPAVRTQHWLHFYEFLSDSSIPFEIIFCGPNAPDYTLPDNFYYIESDVKPIQCAEAAARCTTGELIINVADDVEFVTKDALGKLYKEYVEYGEERLLLSCRFMVDSIDCSPLMHHLPHTDPDALIIAVCGLLSRNLYMELGGWDRNLVYCGQDLDMSLRLWAAEGRVELSKDVYVNENLTLAGSINSFSGGGPVDWQLLNSWWMVGSKVPWQLVNGKIQLNRSQPFEPFLDYNILEESQGPKGRCV